MQPRSAVYQLGTMSYGSWRVVRDELQYPLAQVTRWRDDREQTRQNPGVASSAYLAAPDVLLNSPAQRPDCRTALTVEDSGQFVTVLPFGPGYQRHAQ